MEFNPNFAYKPDFVFRITGLFFKNSHNVNFVRSVVTRQSLLLNRDGSNGREYHSAFLRSAVQRFCSEV
jgi:hypothetical protein